MFLAKNDATAILPSQNDLSSPWHLVERGHRDLGPGAAAASR